MAMVVEMDVEIWCDGEGDTECQAGENEMVGEHAHACEEEGGACGVGRGTGGLAVGGGVD